MIVVMSSKEGEVSQTGDLPHISRMFYYCISHRGQHMETRVELGHLLDSYVTHVLHAVRISIGGVLFSDTLFQNFKPFQALTLKFAVKWIR